MIAAANDNQLYADVVQMTTDFLGPASQRFIDRQIKTHVKKDPSELTADDMEQLTEWLKLAIALLTEDEKMVRAYNENLLRLSGKRKD